MNLDELIQKLLELRESQGGAIIVKLPSGARVTEVKVVEPADRNSNAMRHLRIE